MRIYLVQAGFIKRPMDISGGISKAVSFDYMDSAEFEWGALPESLVAMDSGPPLNVTKHMLKYEDAKTGVSVCSRFVGPVLSEYVELLQQLKEDKLRLKERSGFCPKSPRGFGGGRNCDFWWDIKNHVMFTHFEEFSKHLPKLVHASVNVINAKKATS